MNRSAIHRAALCMTLLGIANPAHGVITSAGVGTHVVVPGISAFGIDLDGVALIAGDVPNSQSLGDLLPLCTGALISDFHVLSAAHCYDNDQNGQLDALFTGFPHAAAFQLSDRTEILRIDSRATLIPDEYGTIPADIAVLVLEEAAPADIPRYSLHTGGDVVGSPMLVAGYGAAGYGAAGSGRDGAVFGFDAQPTKRAGLNRYETLRNDLPYPGLDLLTYDFDSGQSEDNVLRVELDVPSDLGFGDDEVMAARGDSGGPVFVNGAIAAVSAFGARLDDRPEESWGAFGFDVPVSTFRDFITAATDNAATFLLPGDFDGDETLTPNDIDLLSIAIRTDIERKFDINTDGTLDPSDREAWVHEYASTWFGDANLDGEFNTMDLVNVFQVNAYEDEVVNNSGWSTGDWSGDGEFTSSDLVIAFQDGGYERGPRASSIAVPEGLPMKAFLFCIYVVATVIRRDPRFLSHQTTERQTRCHEVILSRRVRL